METTTNNPALSQFQNEEHKTAWLAGRTVEQLESWERACFDIHMIPPATPKEFKAVALQYPQLVEFLKQRFTDRLRSEIAGQVPEDAVDGILADALESVGEHLADAAFGKVAVQRVELENPAEGILMAALAEGNLSPAHIIDLVRTLIKLERTLERKACAKLILALDSQAGKPFAEAIRLRDKQQNPGDACDCDDCKAKDAAAEGKAPQ